MSTASSTIRAFLSRRSRYFERVDTEEDEPTRNRHVELPTHSITDENENENEDRDTTATPTSRPFAVAPVVVEIVTNNDTHAVDHAEDDDEEAAAAAAEGRIRDDEAESSSPGGSRLDAEDHDTENTTTIPSSSPSHQFESLEELIAARDTVIEQARPLVFMCSYGLAMLWSQALLSGNGGILLLTLLLTGLFVQYIEQTQEHIAVYNLLALNWEDDTPSTIRYGNGADGGVGEAAKIRWEKFQYNSRASLIRKENFGCRRTSSSKNINSSDMNNGEEEHNNRSVFTIDDEDDYNYDLEDDNENNNGTTTKKHPTTTAILRGDKEQQEHDRDDDEEPPPVCSICLGDYEKGEALVALTPCRHVFHEECIAAWTQHQTRCPLCNVDLSVVVIDDDDDDNNIV